MRGLTDPILTQHEREQIPHEHVARDVTRALLCSVAYAHAAVVDHTLLVGHTCSENNS